MSTPRIAVSLHVFSYDLIPEFARYLSNITKAGYDYDLYVSILKGMDPTPIKQVWTSAVILQLDNRGFDIASFFHCLHHILPQPYDYILKLHTKTNDQWRKDLIDPLLSTPARVRHAIELLRDQSVGMVGCQKWLLPIGVDWGPNSIHSQIISKLWNVPIIPCKFIGGTIFWIRHDILKHATKDIDLLAIADNLNTVESLDHSWYFMTYPDLKLAGVLTQQDAEAHWETTGRQQGRACNCLYARINHIETPNCDGMQEHAYERFFGLLVATANKQIIGLPDRSLLESADLQTLVLYHPYQHWSVIRGNVHGIQPHPDVGYYDTNDPSTLLRQQEMMMKYGVQGVCYLLSERTVSFIDIINTLQTELPFCISWSPSQKIDPNKLAPLFSHIRYLKVEDKPVVFFDGTPPPNVTPIEFFIIHDFLDIPKTHSLQYQGIVLGDKDRHLSKELVDFHHRQLITHHGFVVLRSWNDWLDQTVLEPSKSFGYKNLHELKSVQKYFS